jgi:hypothetical protein
MKQLPVNLLTDRQKLDALYQKLKEADAKYRERLKNFRGVPHESAMGELNYSELKVREDFVRSLRVEISELEKKLGVPTKLPPHFP